MFISINCYLHRMAQNIRESYAAIKIQSYHRMYVQLKWYTKVKQSTLFLQSCYRRMKGNS